MSRTRLCAVVLAILTLSLASCGSGSPHETPGTVYFLNSDVNLGDIYTQIAQVYHEETGVDIQIDTPRKGTYDRVLTSGFAQERPPTIFQVFGPQGYATYQGYTADISGSQLYAHLEDPTLAIGNTSAVYGLPTGIEAFGIVYNDSLMRKYFALPDKEVSITSADQITSFALLKHVVEDMTAHQTDLGITGVFSTPTLNPEQKPRWQEHLADIVFHNEFRDEVDLTRGLPSEITFAHGIDMGNLVDLAIQNSPHPPQGLRDATRTQALAEFAFGRTALLFGDTHLWEEVSAIQGNVVQAQNIRFMPLYIGGPGEDSQGLSVSSPAYFAINSRTLAADQQASLDFLNWLFSSEHGKMFVSNDLKFISPYDLIPPTDGMSDPLAIEAASWVARDDVTSVPYASWAFPDAQFGTDFAHHLFAHVQEEMDWETLRGKVVNSWSAGIAR